MKIKLLFAFLLIALITQSQTISIVGTGVNGFPPTNGTEITLSTTDNITYTIPNLVITSGFVKFRQDNSWTINWGSNNFPSGTGTQDGPNIPTVAGTYNVTFNRSNGTFTFIGTSAFPSIGIWGTAVDSQNGFGGPDVDMTTTDGIIYTLSGFNFSSGNAYFRQDNASNFLWGSSSFPSGIAVLNGPTIPVTGGEWFVTFNKNTGVFSFAFPSIGILGTALNGFDVADTDLTTTDGFTYTINNLLLTNGFVKFRKDNSWISNWGSSAFPTGTGTQDGNNIPITAGNYNITFDKSTGNYNFTPLLNTTALNKNSISIYPNPTLNNWTIESNDTIEKIIIYDFLGKVVYNENINTFSISVDAEKLNLGIYFAKINTSNGIKTYKLIKR